MRQAVAHWEQRLSGLAAHIDEVSPAPEVWTRIKVKLEAASKPVPFRAIQGGSPTPAAQLLKARNRWRVAALAFGTAAAALVAFIVVRGGEIAPRGTTTLIAAVNRSGDKPAFLIRVDLDSGRMLVNPLSAEIPAGHSLQLWYIGADKAPRSVGLVRTEPTALEVPRGTSADANATLAVSLEPAGGSKTGGPTGPVVYSGQLVPE